MVAEALIPIKRVFGQRDSSQQRAIDLSLSAASNLTLEWRHPAAQGSFGQCGSFPPPPPRIRSLRGFTAHLPHLIALVYYEQTNGLKMHYRFAPRTFEQSLTDMTCAPLSLWRAEESGFSKSESDLMTMVKLL